VALLRVVQVSERKVDGSGRGHWVSFSVDGKSLRSVGRSAHSFRSPPRRSPWRPQESRCCQQLRESPLAGLSRHAHRLWSQLPPGAARCTGCRCSSRRRPCIAHGRCRTGNVGLIVGHRNWCPLWPIRVSDLDAQRGQFGAGVGLVVGVGGPLIGGVECACNAARPVDGLANRRSRCSERDS